ncbi:MAG: hypothetical protein V4719_25835 [Planctomycetota bacterium]
MPNSFGGIGPIEAVLFLLIAGVYVTAMVFAWKYIVAPRLRAAKTGGSASNVSLRQCSGCGTQITTVGNFCPMCGTKISG